MAEDAPPGALPSGGDAPTGSRLWGPPRTFEEHGSRRESALRMEAYLLFALSGVAVLGAALLAAPGSYDLATALLSGGALMALFSTWLLYRAGREASAAVGIYERGVLMPSSFESVPGIATMGGPVFIRAGDVDRVEDMRAGGERAVVVWSRAGRSGILSARPQGTGLAADEASAMLDDFLGVLQGLGWGRATGQAAGEEE